MLVVVSIEFLNVISIPGKKKIQAINTEKYFKDNGIYAESNMLYKYKAARVKFGHEIHQFFIHLMPDSPKSFFSSAPGWWQGSSEIPVVWSVEPSCKKKITFFSM